ncbi:MAG: hypothetical protein KAW88_06495 [Candidatus Cloacimonetes bacterium]|nr:hypothetical protein [Candidatus Cloacimonadota bacterium]
MKIIYYLITLLIGAGYGWPYLFPRSRVGTQCSNALRQNQIGIDSLVLY